MPITPIKKTVPLMEYRQVGTQEITVWMYGGVEYKTEQMAKDQEMIDNAWAVWEKMKRFCPNIDYPKDDCWHFISNEDELAQFNSRIGYRSGDTYNHYHVLGVPAVGDWACSDRRENDEGPVDIYIYTWKTLRPLIMKMIETMDKEVQHDS